MGYYEQGIEFTAQYNHHAAIECYNQALNINPNISDFYRGNAWQLTPVANIYCI